MLLDAIIGAALASTLLLAALQLSTEIIVANHQLFDLARLEAGLVDLETHWRLARLAGYGLPPAGVDLCATGDDWVQGWCVRFIESVGLTDGAGPTKSTVRLISETPSNAAEARASLLLDTGAAETLKLSASWQW